MLEVASGLGIDRRRLTPRFRRQVGVGLQQYGRVRRFERALVAVRDPEAAALADVAAEYGFSDQAHLTREFRTFSGTTPARLHRDGSTMPTHLDGDIFKTASSTGSILAT